METTPSTSDEVCLELLDSATGQPQQSWRFSGRPRILIGRADDNDLVLSNPYVSRSHAYVEYADGEWRAIAISSQKLVVEGKRIQSLPLKPGTTFFLGPSGSCLRFAIPGVDLNGGDPQGTLSFDPEVHPFLQLDRRQLSEEVRAIEEGEFFQSLARNLQQLRRQRQLPT
jgi:hypothetical protein